MKAIQSSITDCFTTGQSSFIENAIAEGRIYVDPPRALYSPENHGAWKLLYATQRALWPGGPRRSISKGWHRSRSRATRFRTINRSLAPRGVRVRGVTGSLSPAEFFEALFEGRFPATVTMRPLSELEFTAQPDLAHDLLGHVPLLAFAPYAAFVRRLGAAAQAAQAAASRFADGRARADFLSRAYQALAQVAWFTVEVGLVREDRSLRAYGAALLSSKADLRASVEGYGVERRPFELDEVLRTPVDYTKVQDRLFIVDDLEQLPGIGETLMRRIVQDDLPAAGGLGLAPLDPEELALLTERTAPNHQSVFGRTR